jgi:hypothetical protein
VTQDRGPCRVEAAYDPRMNAPRPRAGWYPDPSGSGQQYWDGQRWQVPQVPSASRCGFRLPLSVQTRRGSARTAGVEHER